MDNLRRSPSWTSSVASCLLGIVIFGLSSSGAVHGQCPWLAGPTCVPTGSGPYSMCARDVIPTDACNLDADGGMGTNCSLTSMTTFGTIVNLMASQTMTSLQPSAFCEWGCGAITCRIQLSDGLPVELMGFSVEDSAQESDRDEDADEEESRPREH